MRVVVTGAAGYIGSVVTEELLKNGHHVLAVDNLHEGHREAVAEGAEFVEGDLSDPEVFERIFAGERVDVVMHLAAYALVGESVGNPQKYFRNNFVYGIGLLDAVLRHNVRNLVFSSSCAVYGEPKEVPISEEHPKNPVNPYGESKLMFERALAWYGRAYGLSSIALRYFNAAGASERFGEDHNPETHLVPNVLKVALGQADRVAMFGTDYPTKDGTCVRDYLHVLDIARAHLLALDHLGKPGCKAYNLGNSKGYSVLEVVEAARKVTGKPIPAVFGERRPGDPAVLVANSSLARNELEWRPEYSELERIMSSAWNWRQRHPFGYRTA